MTSNKKYKNSIFTSLFNDPDLLRELYCALGGLSLPPDTPVEINTLENVLYMDFINDISFEIGGKLVVLIEHQSTINPNMALRLLLYITRILEKEVEGSRLYSKYQLKIPFPEFFVLYNGTDPFPDTAILRLSDLFEHPQDLGLPEKQHPLLELEVKVININEGRNKELANRCKKLAEYSFFVEKVRFFQKESSTLEEAIKKAIQYCKKHDILKEYLEIHGSEVLNMLLEEWNWDDAKRVWQEEAREEGREEARSEYRQRFLELQIQGLSAEEIQKKLFS
ncbi:MAG: Rpn family recombination-promoting nuclease/putative transposase [Treponema sp.]|jgi:predicted transposase/invertase (TIGR01784 family)|nr:Rpn family recombination-promoting nuclease/putative transposase [Treponema sp.]